MPDAIQTDNLVVKNTFLNVETPSKEDWTVVRGTKSVPFSFKAPSIGLESFGVAFVDDEEDEELEEDEEPSALPTISVRQVSPGVGSPCLVRAVRFMLPDEETRLTVKNTFFTIDEPGPSPKMRPTKSVPVTFSHQLSDQPLPLSPVGGPPPTRKRLGDDEAPSKVAGGGGCVAAEAEYGPDSPISPALCHLRTLSVGPNPEGPHLGLLCAPAGQEWMPEMFMRMNIGGKPTVISLAPELTEQQPPQQRPQQQEAPAPSQPVEAAAAASLSGPVQGNVWAMSQDPQGCRKVQQALDEADASGKAAIAAELKGNMIEAMKSPHANFVLQKLISETEPKDLLFMMDEVSAEAAVQNSKHKFGCRIVQRLIERLPVELTAPCISAILDDFPAMCKNPYGNYVIQNIIVNGTDQQRSRTVDMVEKDIRGLMADAFGTTVVVGAVTKGREEDQVRIARALLKEEGLLVFAACTRHGHNAVSRVLQVLKGEELEEARQVLAGELESLQGSRFGKNVAGLL